MYIFRNGIIIYIHNYFHFYPAEIKILELFKLRFNCLLAEFCLICIKNSLSLHCEIYCKTRMTMTNPEKPSIPTWARILLILVAYFIVAGIFQLIGAIVAGISIKDLSEAQNMSLTQQLVLTIFSLAGTLGIIYIFRKFIDRRTFLSMGFSLKNRGTDILHGLLLAFLVMSIGTILLSMSGLIKITLFTGFDSQTLLYSTLLFIAVAFTEETLCRGYLLNNLMQSVNKYAALGISSAIFTSFHLLNPNVSVLGITNIFLAGILLGASYIFTKNLWFPISLHFFWNFIQGPVLGYQVSGQSIKSFSTIVLNSKTMVNGGDFGFEGSIVCTVLIILGIGAILLFYRNRETRAIPVPNDIA